MVEAKFSKEKVIAEIPGNTTLPYVSQALQMAFEWFLGHGVHYFEVTRETRGRERDCVLTIIPMVEVKDLAWSNVTPVKTLYEKKYIPANLDHPWGPKKTLKAGMHKHSPEEDRTILDLGGFKDDMSMSGWAYGLADCFTGFFLKGAAQGRYQISWNQAQLWICHGMSKKEMTEYLLDPHDYNPSVLVKEFPIKWRPELN